MEKTVLFLDRKIRAVWDSKNGKWLFSIIDIIAILTGTSNPRRYWSDLKRTVKKSTVKGIRKIVQFKLTAADGKMRLTDIASSAVLLRIIQLIPSPKAKPLKEWLKSAGRGVTMLPKPLSYLTEPKEANRLLKAHTSEQPFLILNILEKIPDEKSDNNDSKTTTQGAFFPRDIFFLAYLYAYRLFPWGICIKVCNQNENPLSPRYDLTYSSTIQFPT